MFQYKKNKKIIVANWKMNPNSYVEAINLINLYIETISNNAIDLNNINFIIAPPALYLQSIYLTLKNLNYHNNIFLSAQNICWEHKGSFTGELSASSFKSIGCDFVIIGHSERRLYNQENDALVAKKMSIAINEGLIPIICVGETKQEFNNQETWQVLDRQLKFLKEFTNQNLNLNYFIAYEPVWAIGSGNSASLAYIEKVNNYILQMFPDLSEIKLLYGGSVNATNSKDFINLPNLDGILVGGASLEPEQFFKICKNIYC